MKMGNYLGQRFLSPQLWDNRHFKSACYLRIPK